MQGRRLPIVDGKPTWPEMPGDYCGPVFGYTAEKPCVFFKKPNANDDGAHQRARSIQHVTSPPHTFTEEDDGSLTIRASLGNVWPDGVDDGWHARRLGEVLMTSPGFSNSGLCMRCGKHRDDHAGWLVWPAAPLTCPEPKA